MVRAYVAGATEAVQKVLGHMPAPRRSILLVEDSPADAELVADCFEEQLGRGALTLKHVARLDAAIAHLAEVEIDLVLLDLSLPDSRGLEGLVSMRRSAPNVPIVILTGLNDAGVGEAAVRLGAQDFLIKGELTPSMLIRAVGYAVERHHQQVLLASAQTRFEGAFDSAPIGMAVVDLDGRFLEVNPILTEMLDYQELQLLSVRIWDVLHHDDVDAFDLGFRRLVDADVSKFKAECRLTRVDDTAVWALIAGAVIGGESESPAVIMHVQDITSRKEAEARLVHQTLHDPLTGLPNRVLLQDRIKHALARHHRQGDSLAVWFIDVDRFKSINDTIGHQGGDQVLVEISRRLEQVIRPSDTVARIGGDEFVVLAEGLKGRDEVEVLTERMRARIGAPIYVDHVEIVSSVSIGIAMATNRHHTPEQLIREADTAMFRAKSRGKDRFEIVDDELLAMAFARLESERMIRGALDEDRLLAMYQPIVDLDTGQVVGAEALVRIEDPERGLVPPDEFISVAEETGLIVPLGHWVLATAIEQAVAWQGYFSTAFKIAVNVSAQQVARPAFAEDLASLLEANALAADHICLELTESVLMETWRPSIRSLSALTELGVGLGIDDFGTGYSSLTYLRRFPIDFVKIDQSFVVGLPDDDDDLAIVKAVIGLGRSLGLTTIAEGVETTAQLETLRELGCEQIQGFLVSRPRTARELTDLFASHALDGRI